MIAPGAWLGVLGGGQLGRMFAMAAHRLGYRVAVVDPDPDCPASGVVDRHICAKLGDYAAWQELAKVCAAVTIETECAPAESLRFLARHLRVTPDATALEIAQNRALEKHFLSSNDFPVAPYRTLTLPEDMLAPNIGALLPGLLKTSRFGYDGKGQIHVASQAQLKQAFDELGGPCVLEKQLLLSAELSVILARSDGGGVAVYPVPLNHHKRGILDLSVVPAPVSAALRQKAVTQARQIAETLNYHGVLCVEFFVTEEGQLLVNEIAPRPHNSGHFTIDACRTSQFEQQVRVLAGLPLGDPGMLLHKGGIAMVNLLGDIWAGDEPHWNSVLAHPQARLHLYGKRMPRSGRKMGHITCVAESAGEAAEAATSIRSLLVVNQA